jgi:hypothetical protein
MIRNAWVEAAQTLASDPGDPDVATRQPSCCVAGWRSEGDREVTWVSPTLRKHEREAKPSNSDLAL